MRCTPMISEKLLCHAEDMGISITLTKTYISCAESGLCCKVWATLPSDKLSFLDSEINFFDEVTNVSGKLYPVAKDERKGAAVNFVREVCFSLFPFRRCL